MNYYFNIHLQSAEYDKSKAKINKTKPLTLKGLF